MLFELVRYQEIWWVLIGVVLVLFCFTAGFDLGVGMLFRFVGHTNSERRLLLNVIGPTWDGNQVWLIIAGVCLFAIWPRAYTVAFTSFYGGLMLMLWALYLRPTGFEWRAKIDSTTWRAFWDWALFIGSFLPAFAPGLLFGNILQGVAFRYDDEMRFLSTTQVWQLFNPFALLCGTLSAALLLMHGSNYIRMRTTGEIQTRAERVSRFAAIGFLISFISAMIVLAYGIEGYVLHRAGDLRYPFNNQVARETGAWFANYVKHPLLWIAPIAAVLGAGLNLFSLGRCRYLGFCASLLAIMGTIASYGAGTFPFVIPSSVALNQSLTLYNASSSHYSLQVIFLTALIMLPTIILYTSWIYKKLWGEVTLKAVQENEHTFY